MGTLTNLKTGQTYKTPLKAEEETEEKTGGTLTNLVSGQTYTAPAKAEAKEVTTLPTVETDPIKSAASALKTALPHADSDAKTLFNVQNVMTGGALPVISGTAQNGEKYAQAAQTAASNRLDQLKSQLDTAKTAEQKAIQAANQYVTDNQGWLDMPDRQTQLQALNDAATKATQEREALEKQYYGTSGSFEHETKDYSNAEKAFMGIIASPFRAVDVVAQTAKSAIGGDNTMDMDTLPMQRYQRTQQLKSDATKDLSGAGKLLADAGISVAQNLYELPLNAIMPNASLAAMAVDAAAGKMVDVGNSGGSATNALVRGGISGGIEAATELVSLKSLNNLVKTGVASVLKKTGAELTESTARTVLLNILNQAKSEAMEEGASYALNYVSDKLFKDPNANWDWKELLSSMAAGGISGLFFGLGGTAVNAANNVTTLPVVEQTTEPTTPPMVEQVGTDTSAQNSAVEGVQGQNNTASTGETESTAVNTDPTKHTAVEQDVIEAYQGSTSENLLSFYNEMRSKGTQDEAKGKFGLKDVSARMASDVYDLTGKNIKGFKTDLDGRQAWHISNDHGENGKADHSMANPNDVSRMQYVLDNYDSVSKGGTTDAYWEPNPNYPAKQKRAETVVFSKKVNGTYYVVEAVPITKSKSVKIVSAYMLKDGKTAPGRGGQKNAGNPLQPPDANAPWFTSKTDSASSFPASGTNIRENTAGVNRNSAQNSDNIHIDDRMHEDATNRKVNAFQFDNPEIHPYYADAARALLYDLNNSVKGERFMTGEEDYGGQHKWTGTKRYTTDLLAEYLDNPQYHLSYDSLRQALENIIQDKGHENYAAAKRTEFILDDMLSNGWTDIDGNFTEANQDYINAKEGVKQSAAMSAEGNPTLTMGIDPNAKFLPGSELDNAQRGTQRTAEELPMVDGYGRNTVGSAQAQFAYQEAPAQSVADRMFTEQEMQNHDLESKHQVYSNAQSRADAELMLDTDYEGEVERLKTEEWGPAENVEGHRILENLVKQARKTGAAEDWAKVKEWKQLYDRKGGTEAGQTLQSRAQFADSAATITAEAADFLDSDKAKKLNQGKRTAVMETVAEQSEALENIAEGDTDALIDLIERNSEIRRTTGLFSKKTSRQMDWALHKVAELYPDADSFLRGVAAAQTRAIYTDYAKVSLTEKAKSIRVMNMLSKPSTIMRNLVSNNVFDPLETLSNNVGILADLVMSKATGQRTTAFEKSWASKAKRAGSLEGALKSFIEVGLDADSEYSSGKYEGTSGRTFKMNGNFLERLLSTWSKYESYTLTTTDEFQKGGIRAEAQESINKLKESGKLDEDSLNEWADETARQRTFQNDSVPANLMIKARDALNTVHVGDIGAGDVMLPFTKVPGNLVAQAANYSPVGIANGVVQMAQVMYDAKNGNYSAEAQAQAARNIGRGLTGTGLLAAFTALAAKGIIDVAGADDEDKEALEKAQGRNGTQWNLSATLRAAKGESTEWQDGDTLISIGFLDPINSIMAAGAMIADAYKEDGTLTVEEIADASLSALVQAVLDLPAMSSINNLITTAEYADGETAGEKAWNTAKDYAAGEIESFIIPNALRGIATGLDDTVRNRYSGEGFIEQAKEGVISGTPFARKTLPASLDPFGREKTQTGNTVMNVLNNNFLPGALTKYKETDVEKTLENVYDATGNASVYPTKKAPNSFEIDGEKFTLDAEQKDEFMTTAGKTALEIMMDMIDSDNFQQMNEETQGQYLAVANEYARAVAKTEVSDGKYELSGTNKKIAAAEDAGMSAADYIMYKLNSEAYNEDGEGSMKIDEVAAAIRNSGMSKKEQTAYWLVTYPEWPEKAEEKGVDIEDYINYQQYTYGVEGDKNAKGDTISGSVKKNKIAALVKAGYTQSEAEALYKAVNAKN